MQPIHSNIIPQSEGYQRNLSNMEELLNTLAQHLHEARFEGPEKHLQKARNQGKYLSRERIELLLDQDSPFLELLPLAGIGRDGFGPCGTLVAGIGLVSGKICLIASNIGTKKGGAIDHATVQKHQRIAEIAYENHLPVINLVESAGVNLPEQENIFNNAGTMFREITKRSKLGAPTISVVFGSSTAGGAYIPGMSDYAIFVKDQAQVFLAGPPLVKMATNEDAVAEELGGASMHSKISGVSDYLADDELDGIRKAREIMAFYEPAQSNNPRQEVKPPLYAAEEIHGILPPDIKQPFDAREIIARVVDGSAFHEFKAEFGPTLITGYAHINGFRVGIIANNGVLFSDAANKGAHFIQLCNMNAVPIVFFQNITGFMVGKKYEQEGIIKHGAKLINAVSNSEVPAITIMTGASYGAGNYAMMGRMYKPRFLFTYPNAKISVMGGEQLAGVMDIIRRGGGKVVDEQQLAADKQALVDDIERKSTPYYSSGHLWDDGVIQPSDTRIYLSMCLEVIHLQTIESSRNFGIFRM
ncbi:acyl-CoA carboxylase subunit beta [Persicobacter psychrovividus]|uniref:Acetyl-CoA carboxylase carboxyltransferase subunit n=1 Tax=Persicobacter psychrovividus TaxID=387638 RepID=A0ABN6LAY3_9BACT|nr:acetyl-CoA carboxylase carboxyltransferase subunit [Persicobacter psychrovividus]